MLAFLEPTELIEWLNDYQYYAMFGILFLCGIGLPIPEEVTLIGSGVVVYFSESAHFLPASTVCVAAILIGDSIIFFTGRKLGQSFPDSWFIRAINNKKVHRQFEKHGNKAVFFARFLAGVRIGVYGYAGQHGMRWTKFIFLDLLGALISGPTSVLFGWWAAKTLAPGETPEAALEKALELFEEYKPIVLLVVVGLVTIIVLYAIYKTRRYRTEIKRALEEKKEEKKLAGDEEDEKNEAAGEDCEEKPAP
ncbi:MAG: DedA family protein [Planctomycetota bacterium]|nr:DedA family protein [Planctomycetota bacterium]|tara:strand:+ start:2444 stop:3193 length:750 start_codon:yes stop_codon:yes gene_type:complete